MRAGASRFAGLGTIDVDNRLGEDFAAVGRCNPEGKPFSYLSREEADAAVAECSEGRVVIRRWRREEGVPSLPDDVARRVGAAVPAIVRAHAGAAAGVLLVTHGDLINAFLPGLEGDEGVGAYKAEVAGFAVVRVPADGALPSRVAAGGESIVARHRVELM